MTTRNDSELQRLGGSEDTVYTLHGNINMAHRNCSMKVAFTV